MHWLFVLQVPSTWVCSLPHQESDCIQLCHPILKAGSNMEGSVSVISLQETKWHLSKREVFMKAVQKPEEGINKVIRSLMQLLKPSTSTFAFTKDRQLGSSKKRRMSSRFASSAAKCKAVRPLLRSLTRQEGETMNMQTPLLDTLLTQAHKRLTHSWRLTVNTLHPQRLPSSQTK